MRIAARQSERSRWKDEEYPTETARPERDSEAWVRAEREAGRREEARLDRGRERAQALEAERREQRAQSRERSDRFSARRARAKHVAATEESAAAQAPAHARPTAGPSRPQAAPRDVEEPVLASPTQKEGGQQMFVPAMTPRAQALPESATQALAKYGAVMGASSRPAQAAPAAPQTAVAQPAEAAPVLQKGEARELRPVARKAAPQPGAQAERMQQAREILEQVRVNIAPGMREATIALTPAHLGRIGIKLELRDRELVAVIRAERPEALAALEENLPELRSMLEEAGITPGDFDLGLGFDGQSEQGFDEARSNTGAPAAAQAARAELQETRLAHAIAAGGIDLIA